MCRSDYTKSGITISVRETEEVSEKTGNFSTLRRSMGEGAAEAVVPP